jgi:hypothetical protein
MHWLLPQLGRRRRRLTKVCRPTCIGSVFNIGSPIPIDANGISFQVGGSALNYGFGLYDAGDGTIGEILAGNAPPQPDLLIPGKAGGTLEYEVISEPAALALLSVGLIGMRLMRRRSTLEGCGS